MVDVRQKHSREALDELELVDDLAALVGDLLLRTNGSLAKRPTDNGLDVEERTRQAGQRWRPP